MNDLSSLSNVNKSKTNSKHDSEIRKRPKPIEMKKDPESEDSGDENSFFEGIGKQETLGEMDLDDAFIDSSNPHLHHQKIHHHQ